MTDNLELWQLLLVGILYTAYLCWVMFGGMKKRKIKLRMYLIMTALMIYGVAVEYNGIHSTAEILNICGVLLIGLVKGIYLGRLKNVEKIDQDWYISHSGKYIVIWVAFLSLSLLLHKS